MDKAFFWRMSCMICVLFLMSLCCWLFMRLFLHFSCWFFRQLFRHPCLSLFFCLSLSLMFNMLLFQPVRSFFCAYVKLCRLYALFFGLFLLFHSESTFFRSLILFLYIKLAVFLDSGHYLVNKFIILFLNRLGYAFRYMPSFFLSIFLIMPFLRSSLSF